MCNSVILVLPVHNEKEYLKHAIRELEAVIREMGQDFLLVVAEDGSDDSTYEIASRLAEEYENLKVLHSPTRLGRGKAVRKAFSMFEGDIYIFMDADLATDPRYLDTLVGIVDSGYDLVCGSRYIEGGMVKRPLLRKIASLMYNFIIRRVFRTGIQDHQCGFKGVSKRFRDFLIDHSHSNHWFWDTEITILAKRNGFKVAEFPVTWLEKRSSRTPLKRLIEDILEHSAGVFHFLSRG